MGFLSKKLLFLLAAVVMTLNVSADTYLKRELRGTWMTSFLSLDWPSVGVGVSSSMITSQKNEAIDYLNQLEKAHINAVYLQVRPCSDAFYKSSYEPWSSYLTGSRGADPGWDPLEFWVEEAHKRGIELHAWVNPYRFATAKTGLWNSTNQDKNINNKGWLLEYNDTYILNPGLSDVTNYICDIVGEIVTKYDVDGVIFDDYFYPDYIPQTSAANDWNLFQSSGWSSIGNWRRNNVNQMINAVNNRIKSIKPYCSFGVSPAGIACTSSSVASGHGVARCTVGSDWQYDRIYSDPVAWLKNWYLDFVSPQLYWGVSDYGSSYPLDELDPWWSTVANQFSRQYYASIADYRSDVDMGSDYSEGFGDYDAIKKQIQYNRSLTKTGAPGIIHYRSLSFKASHATLDLVNNLVSTVYQKPALPPTMSWKKGSTTYGKVDNLEVSGTKLVWDAPASNIRYIVYAIPESKTTSAVQSTVSGGGIASDYMLGVTYTNSYAIPSAYQSGYYFAVTVYDRYGYEYDARYSNEITKFATKVTLTQPSNGATGVEGSATFSWTAGTGTNTKYAIQISSKSDFSTIAYEQSGLTTNSTTINVRTQLEGLTKYYWHITTSENNAWDCTSDASSFTTADKTPAGATTLQSPANGSTLDDVSSFGFTWAKVTDCTYFLQIAADANFSNVIYSADLQSNSTTISAATLPYNQTLYWRVTTSKEGYKDSVSEVWSFNTPRREYAEATTLVSPTSGTTVAGSFFLEFTHVNATQYTLELSTSSSFSSTVINTTLVTEPLTAPDGWGIADNGNWQYFISASALANATYYWRVKTSAQGVYDSYSETRSFKVNNASSENSYSVTYDNTDYNPAGCYNIENLWIRTASFGNMPSYTDFGFNRDFCVKDNVIYVTGRDTNSSTSACYLAKFNALTGAYIGKLSLSSSVQGSYFPNNSIFKDSNGNVCIANLTLNCSTTALVINRIDLSTGSATKVASVTSSTGGRIDHCNVYGDVTSGNFFVLACEANTERVQKWTYRNGSLASQTTFTAPYYWPSNAGSFGMAPRVMPIDNDWFFINGCNTSLTKYNFSTGEYDTFDNADNDVIPEIGTNQDSQTVSTGGTFFQLGEDYFVVYPNKGIRQGSTFNIVSTNSDYEYALMERLWEVPGLTGGFGPYATNSYGDICADHEISSDGKSANVYFYLPSIGFAAYTIYRNVPSGVEETVSSLKITRAGNRLTFNTTVDIVEIYNTAGALISRNVNTSNVNIGALKGLFIVRCTTADGTYTRKISI
ncbi:MAG: family 10 glycosylhydrolase [Candidatus Limisoma sp.]